MPVTQDYREGFERGHHHGARQAAQHLDDLAAQLWRDERGDGSPTVTLIVACLVSAALMIRGAETQEETLAKLARRARDDWT